MKKCFFCKRIVMGKSYLGMCPKCFNNLIHVLLIFFMSIMIPLIAFFVTIFIMTPVAAALPPLAPAEILADIGVGISAIIGIIVGYAIVVFLIVKLVINNIGVK